MPALDGLRGLAVLAVVLYHGGVAGLGGGFLGVDAFFVLSGFLITSLLLVEWGSTGAVSLRRFWERRARRLLPALVVLLLAVVALARWTDQASVVASRGDVGATLAYVQNWHLITAGHGYFAQSALPSSLQHTWSLSIEEQFYLGWPLLLGAVFLAARRRTRGRRPPDPQTRARVLRLLLAATLLAAAASTADMVLRFDPDADPSPLYYGTDTRAGSLLLGASLALVLALRARREDVPLRRGPHATLALAGWTSVLVVAVLWVRAEGSSPWLYRGGMALGEIAVVLVIATVVVQPRSVLARLLSWRPLRALGSCRTASTCGTGPCSPCSPRPGPDCTACRCSVPGWRSPCSSPPDLCGWSSGRCGPGGCRPAYLAQSWPPAPPPVSWPCSRWRPRAPYRPRTWWRRRPTRTARRGPCPTRTLLRRRPPSRSCRHRPGRHGPCCLAPEAPPPGPGRAQRTRSSSWGTRWPRAWPVAWRPTSAARACTSRTRHGWAAASPSAGPTTTPATCGGRACGARTGPATGGTSWSGPGPRAR